MDKTPAKVFKTGKIYTTKKGLKIKYIAGVRYYWAGKWVKSKFQDRNRNLKEISDRGL